MTSIVARAVRYALGNDVPNLNRVARTLSGAMRRMQPSCSIEYDKAGSADRLAARDPLQQRSHRPDQHRRQHCCQVGQLALDRKLLLNHWLNVPSGCMDR